MSVYREILLTARGLCGFVVSVRCNEYSQANIFASLLRYQPLIAVDCFARSRSVQFSLCSRGGIPIGGGGWRGCLILDRTHTHGGGGGERPWGLGAGSYIGPYK